MAVKLLVSVLIVTICISTCEAGIIEDFLGWLFGITTGKRSLSQVITSYLDSIFKKDDLDTELMKQLFMVYAEDDVNMFNSNFVGLEENV